MSTRSTTKVKEVEKLDVSSQQQLGQVDNLPSNFF
jgi:hypothetical protein